ncbi:MAG: radical SAM protein [Candidatus Omnitrophica bacterium]|nr:radical SAM protein [Candidatus Omnitrophota bacterium]MDD5690545.1 radical SAM protein [Candidatus Omnitrophota bacterium]
MGQGIDILLIIPHQPGTADILSGASGITPPLGAGYIASYLEKNNFSVKILDNSIERLNETEFRAYIKKVDPLYAGFSVCTSSYNNAVYMANIVKEINRDIKVIMGGVHASALPGEVLKNEAVDIVVKGEGEETTLNLLRALNKNEDLSKINGLVFRGADKLIETPERELIVNIDNLPFPAYHLLNMNKYSLPAQRRLTDKPCGAVITSRGCVYKCFFCSHNSIFKGKIRFRSVQNVIAEIKHLVADYKIGELLIWDDSFLLDRGRALEFCRLIKEEKIDIIWSCSSRVNQISDDLAKELYTAGCRLILFGAESGSQLILDSINKNTTLLNISDAISACRKNRILSFCSFILGTPQENEETIEETLRFVKKINPDFAIFCIFSPLPGSVFFDRFISTGQLDISKLNWDNYINLLSNAPPVISLCQISEKRLVLLQKKCFRSFYFRPKYILQRLKNIRSWGNFYQSWRGLLALARLQLNKFRF